MGELLKEFDARGGDQSKKEVTRPFAPSREAIADSAGISEHQRKQAVRVANIPKAEPAKSSRSARKRSAKAISR
jgi:hypothetical protein